MKERTTSSGIPTFILIWFGQLISLIGTGLTGFALGVWVYRETGSVTQFALISLFTVLPTLVILPLAGAIVDRVDRKLVLIGADLVAGLSTLVIALLLGSGLLQIWQIYIIVAIRSLCDGYRWPALSASVTLLVPSKQLGRANGMMQGARAASQILPPVLAGILVLSIGIEGVILVDFATFLFAIITLLLVPIPRPKPAEEEPAEGRSLLRETAYGWRYIAARPGLLGLLLVFAVINLQLGIVSVLVTPLVLSVASAASLGTVLSIGGMGMLVGSVVMSVWGGPKRRMHGVFGFMLLGGLFIVLGGLRPLVPLFAAAAFGFFFCLALLNGCFWTIWQSRVAPGVQGRVFATIQMIAGASLPLGFLIAGPLADRVFEPLLAPAGPLAGSVGQIIGVGQGRGVALLFIVMGALQVLTTLVGYLNPRLRLLEDEVPEATPEEAPASVPGAALDGILTEST